MGGQWHSEQLKRGLKNHHIQLIALDGAIGTELFLDSASVIQSAGPRVILSYAIAGFIAFLIIRQLGEVVVEEPVAGSFSHFACKYWGSFADFASGQNYRVLYILTAMAELIAVDKYTQFRCPEIPTWVSAAVLFVVIDTINLTDVKVFGGMEFWSAIIKVIAVVTMIIFGIWLLSSDNGGPQASVNNLWDQDGSPSHGFTGPVMMMMIIIFSFGGLELVGITATEADNPEQSIPKVTNQIIYRILVFCIGSLAILLSLMLWTRVTADTSPFILIFHELGDTFVANVLNIVVLTAAFSVYNSYVYCNGRMLFSLAQQGNTPRTLASVDKRDVPVNTTLVSALITALYILINYLAPESTFGLLMVLVVSTLVINWAMISPMHTKFRRTKQKQGVVTHFPTLLYPLGNWICLLSMTAVLVTILMTPGMTISVHLIPVQLIVLGIGYLLKEKTAEAVKAR